MTSLARIVSVIGHPLVLMPLATWVALRQAPSRPLLIALLLVIAAVLGYSIVQVRRGQWRHIDAVQTRERKNLNLFLLAVFCALAAMAWSRGLTHGALLPGLAAAIIACALLIARRCKLSLHLAFALYAGGVIAVSHPAPGAAVMVLAMVIGWSRLHLGRHAPPDLAAGTLAGAAAGLAYWHLATYWEML